MTVTARRQLAPLDLTDQALLNVNKSAAAFASAAGEDKVNAQLFGCDPTGTTAIDTAFAAIVAALPSTGGEVFLGEGTFKVGTSLIDLLATTQTVKIRGAATMSTVLDYHGSTDCLRMYNDVSDDDGGGKCFFSGVSDLTISGTSAQDGAIGLRTGDFQFAQVHNVLIRDFAGEDQIGWVLENATTWTEEGDYRAAIWNCTRGVVLRVTTGYNSFGYSNFDLTFLQSGAQSCFTLEAGALLYHGRLKIRGDVTGSASALTGNPAVIVATGIPPEDSPSAGSGGSALSGVHLDVMIESNDTSGATPHLMSTLYLDASTFGYMVGCYGMMDFGQGTGAFAPLDPDSMPDGATANLISFSGIIFGDATMNPDNLTTWIVIGGPDDSGGSFGGGTLTSAIVPKVTGLTDAATIAVDASLGNDFYVTLTANRTMGAPSNPADGQSITFEIASAGHTLTWNAAYSFGSATAPSTSTSATYLFTFRYSARKSKWLYLGALGGF